MNEFTKKQIVLLVALLGLSTTAMAQDYDLVILGGRVMDPETSYDGVANVGIKNGRIAVITKKSIEGKETIDATGHVVAPGFIDTHFHWQAPLGYKIGLRDGLTSSMDIEEGCAGTTLGSWYEERIGKTAVNFGCASSHELARSIVLDKLTDEDVDQGPMSALETRKKPGWSSTQPSLEQGNEILRIIDKGLQDGGVGIGSTVGYMRYGVTTREMYEVQKVAARWGRHTAVHTRFTPDDANFENLGAQEVIANALALDAPATINHYNNPGWKLAHELMSKLQDQGYNIWGEIYPYAAGSTTLNAVFLKPENWVEKLGHRYEDTMADAVTGEFYTQETYEKGLKENPTKEILLYKMPEEDAVKWLKLKGTTMASDAMNAEPSFGPWETPLSELGNMHPRGAGARGASVRLARENDIPLMQIMAILSYNAAKHLGDTGLKAMQERGRIQKGMVADIVVFHPDNFRDNATYQNGSLPSTGMKCVLVDGTVVLKDDAILADVFPGQPIRFEPESKPRFEPISEEAWEDIYMTATPHLDKGEFATPQGQSAGALRGASARSDAGRAERGRRSGSAGPLGDSGMSFRREAMIRQTIILAAGLCLSATAMAQDYDLVILGGRVMDPETSHDAVANVGIKDGRIAVITEKSISGKEAIDATGHVVAPGFIDTHNHWQRAMGYKIALRDGVTTSFDLEFGTVGSRVDEWYAERVGKSQANYGTASSHKGARSVVIDKCPEMYDAPGGLACRGKYNGWSETLPTLDQGNEILRIIDQGLADGALGVGATLGYFRDGASAREVYEVQKVGARYGRQYGAHNRQTMGTSTTEPIGAQEIIANGVSLQAPVLVCHYNNAGWDVIHEMITNLQAQGFNIWGEMYPYTAGQTNAGAVFLQPAIFEDQLGYEYDKSVMDPVTGKYLSKEEFLEQDPAKELLIYKQPEESIEKWLRLKGVALANDALMGTDFDPAWDTPYDQLEGLHPRTAGARGLALRYVREKDIPLMGVLAQLSYVSAKHLGDMGLKSMQERGRVQKGMAADLVVFDPATVTDNSTYEESWKTTTGIQAVIVNGTVVVRDDEVLPVYPGQPIRFEKTGPKFEPLSAEKWEQQFLGGFEIPGEAGMPHPDTHPEHFKKDRG